MRVLITGGAGFIGSHLADACFAQGDQVSILDNLSTGSKDNISHLEGKITVLTEDIRNQSLVETLVENSDLVLHMAAALGVDNILNNPIESISTNFYGSEVVLNAAAKFDKKILIASTSEIYGKNTKQTLTESDDRIVGSPQKIRWTYSDAKALEEAYAHILYLKKNLKVTTIRLFNTVGPRQIGNYGMVLPKFVIAALKNNPLLVNGSGEQKRVFCHVKDAVRAIMLLINSKNSIGEVYNIGGVQEISIIELARKIVDKTKSKSAIKLVSYEEAYPVGFEEMERRCPDISKIKLAINWEPQISLDEIIDDVVNYFA